MKLKTYCPAYNGFCGFGKNVSIFFANPFNMKLAGDFNDKARVG